MAKMKDKIESVNDLQKLMPRLLEEHGNDKKLMKAAIANPILALESLGYSLAPSVKKEIEKRVRFNKKQQQKIEDLEKKMNKISPKKFDPSSSSSIHSAINAVFKGDEVTIGKKSYEKNSLLAIISTPPAPSFLQRKPEKDPLDPFKQAHELIPLLMEYRKIEASTPQLAPKKIFDAILKGKEPKLGIRISNVRMKLQDRSKRKK